GTGNREQGTGNREQGTGNKLVVGCVRYQQSVYLQDLYSSKAPYQSASYNVVIISNCSKS
ncbi:MAG: hypothetical protein ACK5P3_12515, partial [Dolichospermum sp.]